ncbi:MAG: alanine--tRNA ligase, partial [Elusimicrobia bacterium]|nr:alanine--tRNA ligase [Elusimicrobiota bacterium]
QFKKNFLGQSADKFTRAASSQKCFRTSDIDKVGHTNRHLTFFEMLGNFSFGDYFKTDAIAWGWEFLTKEMSLPKEKLYATIFKDDSEAYDLWKKIVPESKIIRMGEETNFWNMGPTGPCGPCSEILYDLGPEYSCKKPDCGPHCDCDRYLEVWNLVFTQFDRQEDGSLKNLPRKNIDTGMGLERLAAVANGKTNVFETDLFAPIIEELSDILEVKISENPFQLRMMADHVRSVCFLIADGILPSNEGRGYVLRRILRRALRQGKMFGAEKPFLYRLSAEVAEIMKSAYPELSQRRENIASITKMEEEKFLETLESGTKILEEIMAKYKSSDVVKNKGNLKSKFVIPGDEVFKLYDTYGFPLDLTKEIAKENGLDIDEEGFKSAQRDAQKRSRAAWSGSGEKDLSFYSELHKDLGNTVFVGYDKTNAVSKVLALTKNHKKVNALNEGEEGEIILSETPFYAESGGQEGDTGEIKSQKGAVLEVKNAIKPVNNFVIHKVEVKKGTIAEDEEVTGTVDIKRRENIMRHHTATHLLHKALREVLGKHVTQAGSLVAQDFLRFDFTHLAALKSEEITAVEEIVNNAIRDNMPVCVSQMSLGDARKVGAMALFGEKYTETVRAVAINDEKDNHYSLELCGGTHVRRTGDIGMFKLISETSIAAGTRRIEAVAGEAAEKYFRHIDNLLDDISSKLKATKTEISAKLDKLMSREKEFEKEISKLKSQLASGGTQDLLKSVKDVKGVKLLTAKLADTDINSLRDLSDNLRIKMGSGIIILANIEKEKLSFVVSVTKDLVEQKYSAGKIAKNLASLVGGSGGGKNDFAQGGGKDISKIDSAFNKISEHLL